MPVIGYKHPGDSQFVYLLPKITMGVVREYFRRGEDEPLGFSTTAIGKQLAEEGYIYRPSGDHLTSKVRLPGAGRKLSPARVWKFYASRIGELETQGIVIVPGLIYHLWRANTKYFGCPKCKYQYVVLEDKSPPKTPAIS